MDPARRRPPPPRISIDPHSPVAPNGQPVFPGRGNNTVTASPAEVELMEQRYAEALADTTESRITQGDRDDLAHTDTMYPPKMSHEAILNGSKNGGTDSVATTPETETEFDWEQTDSEDEEQVAASRRAREEDKYADQQKTVIKRAKRLRKVYLACMRLSRPVRTLLLALVGGGILSVPTIVVWTRFYGDRASARVTDNVKVWSLWLTILWTSSCATSLFVDAIPWMVSKISILLTGLYPQTLKYKVNLFDGARFWLKCILVSIWSWISGSVLTDHIFTGPDLDYFRWVLHAIQSIFASSIVLYVEKLIVQNVKASFHETNLKDRIEENARALWALDKLASAKKTNRTRRGWGFHSRPRSHVNTPAASRPVSRQGSPERWEQQAGTLGHQGEAVVEVPLTPHGGQPTYTDRDGTLRNRSAMKGEKDGALNTSVGAAGSDSPDLSKLHGRSKKYFRRRANSKTIAEQLTQALSAATLKDKQNNATSTQHSATKMAKRLFEGLGNTREYLIPEDFVPYFNTKADAEVAFALFDKDGNGDISKKEMRGAVQRIYRERKALKASLQDMGSAVRKLDAVMLAVCLVIILFIWFLIFDRTSTISSLTSISTIVAALSFIFSNAASTLFNSMIFIFSTQPYSIGDLCFIDGDPLVVKEFGLMSTVFERVDGQVMIMPNSILSTTKHILNVRRSGAMWETTNIQIGYDTPLELISELRSKMRSFVNENNREWAGGLDINFNNINNQNYIELIVAMQHKGNWQDWGGRWNRRTKLMRHMKQSLDELGIVYKLPLQPVQLQVRGGPAPWNPNSQNGTNGQTGPHGFNIVPNNQFLSPDALGNGARIGGGSFQPGLTRNVGLDGGA